MRILKRVLRNRKTIGWVACLNDNRYSFKIAENGNVDPNSSSSSWIGRYSNHRKAEEELLEAVSKLR